MRCGVAPRAREHRIGDQPIVENDVRLLQQLQRAQRQQIRITRARADQVDLAARGVRSLAVDELDRRR